MSHKAFYLASFFCFLISCNSSNDSTVEWQSANISNKLFSKDEQHFKIIKTTQLIEIQGLEGTVLVIPANSLINKETSEAYIGECTIILREFYNLSDILLENLNTMTYDGRLLSTGGMIYVEIKDSNDYSLGLKQDMAYEIRFPKQEPIVNNDMKLFYGSKVNEFILWEESSDNLILTDQVWGLYDSIIEGENNLYQGTVDYFIFKGTKFGWINCDAFVNFENPNLLCKVIVSDPIKSYHRIIDKKSMSIGVLYQERKQGSYEFSQLQKGGRYWILSINTDGSDYYYYLDEMELHKKITYINPIYSKVSLRKLKEKLRLLES